MITIPICPPWDNASKNRAYNIALNVKKHRIHLMTRKGHVLPHKTGNVVFEAVYRTKYPFLQKFFLFLRLLRSDSHIKIYHFFFQPTYMSALVFKCLLKVKKKIAVQTILNIFEEGQDLKQYIFGDVILVSSEYMQNKLIDAGFTHTRRINPGVDCVRFKPRAASADIKKKLGLGAESVVLYSGEYLEIRGIYQFLDAIKQITERMNTVRFVFACRVFGKQDLFREQQIKRRTQAMNLSKHVVFLQTCEDMPGLIGLSDISIFPTLEMYDKMDIPMTLLESLAMEKPIVISDVPPLNELMKSKVGILVTPGDSKELADAVLYLLTNEQRRKEMGMRGREMVLKHFNIKDIAKKYDELYDREVLHAISK